VKDEAALVIALGLASGFEFDENDLKRSIRQIFRQVRGRGHRDDLPGLPWDLLCSSVGIAKPDVRVSQKDCHHGGVRVHGRLLAWAIPGPEHAHLLIVNLHGVVLRIDRDGITFALWLRHEDTPPSLYP
jgi:hypothetical protein